jgi:hypothetical protein
MNDVHTMRSWGEHSHRGTGRVGDEAFAVVFPLVECCYQQPRPTALSRLASVSPWGGPRAGSRHLPALQVLAMPVEHAAGLDQPLMQRP